MSKLIFVNLPVADLKKSMSFYAAIGFTNNPQFTDDTAACMVISGDIFTMLLTHEKFKQFTPKPIADATRTTEVLVALSRESRDAIDDLIDRAAKAGGKSDPGPKQDHGFMYSRSFEDPDGHIWEVVWMDVEAAKAAMAGTETTAA